MSREGQRKRYASDADRRTHTYIDGNTVRKEDLDELLAGEPRRAQYQNTRRNREKASHMNVGSLLFLIGALILASVALISYINLQSQLTSSVKNISAMEKQLYSLQQSNDEYENRIHNSIDLEEVKRIAIEELGMKYATEGQIVTVEGGGDDYVRKYTDIPK